jgi:hypothetical protein
MRSSAILIAFLCMSGSVFAQPHFVYENQGSARVIGLLDLPDVRAADDECRSTESRGAQVYAKPSGTGAALGTVYQRKHPEYGCGLLFKRARSLTEEYLPSEESGSEILAAVVYERRGRWFRIAIPQGSGWIERANDNDFLAYPLLLSRKLAFLRTDWDGQLRQNAGFGFPTVSVPLEWKERLPKLGIEIEVLEMMPVGNDDWIHVRFAIGRCGDATSKMLKAVQGWLPAYRADGATTAWFHSRGC